MEDQTDRSLSCNFCCKKSTDFFTLVDHKCYHFSCSSCSAKFQYDFQLKKHEKQHLVEDSVTSLTCTLCGITVETNKLLEIHMTSYHKSRPCGICERPTRPRNGSDLYCRNCSSIIKKTNDFQIDSLSMSDNISENCVNSSNSSTNQTKCLSDRDGNVCKNSRLAKRKKSLGKGNSEKVVKRLKGENKEKVQNHNVSETGHKSKVNKKIDEPPKSIIHVSTKGKFNKKFVESPKSTIHVSTSKETLNILVKHQTQAVIHTRQNSSERSSGNASEASLTFDKALPTNTALNLFKKGRRRQKHPKDITEKKDLKNSKMKASEENSPNFNLQRVQRQRASISEDPAQFPRKVKNNLPTATNCTTGMVKIQSLLNSAPDKNFGILLQSDLKKYANFSCTKCGKLSRTLKLGSVHYSSCGRTAFVNNLVPVENIRWVCTLCHSHIIDASELAKHQKICRVRLENYDKSSLRVCSTCNFSVISRVLFQKHNCEEELHKMRSCRVVIKNLPEFPANERSELYNCSLCQNVFVGKESFQQHLEIHRRERFDGSVAPVYLDLAAPRIKTEVVSPEDACSYAHYSQNSGQHSNPMSLSGSLNSSHHQRASTSHSTSTIEESQLPPPTNLSNNVARILNQQICKCKNRYSSTGDVKPCLKCLSKIIWPKDMFELSQTFDINKVKQEPTESPSETDPSRNNVAATLMENSNMICLESLLGSSYLEAAFSQGHMTPPSFTGLTPPSTPENLLMQASVDPAGLSNEEMGSFNGASVSDISQFMNETDSLFSETFVGSLSGEESVHCDSEELLTMPSEQCKVTHLRDADNFKNVDAYAVVVSEDSTIVQKYICTACFWFTCKDQNLLTEHVWLEHDKKDEIFAVYVCTPSDNKSEN